MNENTEIGDGRRNGVGVVLGDIESGIGLRGLKDFSQYTAKLKHSSH